MECLSDVDYKCLLSSRCWIFHSDCVRLIFYKMMCFVFFSMSAWNLIHSMWENLDGAKRRNLSPTTRAQWIWRDAQPLVCCRLAATEALKSIIEWEPWLFLCHEPQLWEWSQISTEQEGNGPGIYWKDVGWCIFHWGTHVFSSFKIVQIECKGNVNHALNKSFKCLGYMLYT